VIVIPRLTTNVPRLLWVTVSVPPGGGVCTLGLGGDEISGDGNSRPVAAGLA
jgi:hypothetical protein